MSGSARSSAHASRRAGVALRPASQTPQRSVDVRGHLADESAHIAEGVELRPLPQHWPVEGHALQALCLGLLQVALQLAAPPTRRSVPEALEEALDDLLGIRIGELRAAVLQQGRAEPRDNGPRIPARRGVGHEPRNLLDIAVEARALQHRVDLLVDAQDGGAALDDHDVAEVPLVLPHRQRHAVHVIDEHVQGAEPAKTRQQLLRRRLQGRVPVHAHEGMASHVLKDAEEADTASVLLQDGAVLFAAVDAEERAQAVRLVGAEDGALGGAPPYLLELGVALLHDSDVRHWHLEHVRHALREYLIRRGPPLDLQDNARLLQVHQHHPAAAAPDEMQVLGLRPRHGLDVCGGQGLEVVQAPLQLLGGLPLLLSQLGLLGQPRLFTLLPLLIAHLRLRRLLPGGDAPQRLVVLAELLAGALLQAGPRPSWQRVKPGLGAFQEVGLQTHAVELVMERLHALLHLLF
mmetsp:Transcript_80995/g.252744  ORF Transcript_80995/g.252744 Transcript_80995/m.252744 type:complete len:463 (+) Transcript_80995:47-1435(+)